MTTKGTIADTLDVVGEIADLGAAPVAPLDPMVAAGIGMLGGVAHIAARLLRAGVEDPVAHITRALDIASRVKAQEAEAEAALRAKFGDTTPEGSSPR